MSQQNKDSDKQQEDTSKVSIDFDTFKTYYSSNPDLDNAEYYQIFPSVNPGTIRSWKAKAKKMDDTEPSQTPPTPQDPSKDEKEELKKIKGDLIKALIEKTRFDEGLLNGLDEDSQLKLLQNASSSMTQDPNIRMFTPAGLGPQKMGIEKYLKMDMKSFKEKGFGDVELAIPASVIFDPNKSKDLAEYK